VDLVDWHGVQKVQLFPAAPPGDDEAGVFEHAQYNGSLWSPGQAIPLLSGEFGAGVVVLTDGTHLIAATIAIDSSVRVVEWSGGAWGAWSSLEDSVATRSYLSGYSSASAGKAALVWTETGASGHQIAGRLVTF